MTAVVNRRSKALIHLRTRRRLCRRLYRSKANETWLARNGLVSNIHRRKPKVRPMHAPIRRGNATKSKVRAFVEHVLADQKRRMGMKISTIGLAQARIKIGLANIAYNMRRLIFHQRRAAAAATA